jgi:hypothetical protein
MGSRPLITSDGEADDRGLLASLITLTRRREDFITECFAAVLRADSRARREYWRLLLHGVACNAVTRRASPSIETQQSSKNGSARFDLVVASGRVRVAVEHKLTAAQGPNQLTRYMRLPRREVTHVALVAADYQGIAANVRRHRRYICPSSNKNHFLWADFYPLVARSARRGSSVARDTRHLMDDLGLQPAHPLIGDLRTRDPGIQAKRDKQLYRAWGPLRKALSRRWTAESSLRRVTTPTRWSEIYIVDGPKGEDLRVVWIDPFSNPGSLRIRLKSDRRAKRDAMLMRLERRRAKIPYGDYVDFAPVRLGTSAHGTHWAIEARIPWRVLLRGCNGNGGRKRMPQVLKRFVLGLMRAAASHGI